MELSLIITSTICHNWWSNEQIEWWNINFFLLVDQIIALMMGIKVLAEKNFLSMYLKSGLDHLVEDIFHKVFHIFRGIIGQVEFFLGGNDFIC